MSVDNEWFLGKGNRSWRTLQRSEFKL